MAPVNIDVLGRFFGSEQGPTSASETTHRSMVDSQSQKDIADKLREIADVAKRTEDIQRKTLTETGDYNKELIQGFKDYRATAIKDVQETLFKGGAGMEQSQTQASAYVNRIFKTPEGDVNEVVKDFAKNTREASNHLNDLIRALGGGFGGGMMASGMISGNPLSVLQGAMVTGASIWQSEGIGKKLQTSVLAGLAAVSQFGDEAIRVAPESVSQATQMERSLIRGGSGTSLSDMFGMGKTGTGFNVLTPEQKMQFSDLFASTGGGTQAQLVQQMDLFGKYSLIYGEAAMGMMQASRKLDMWVPSGDFSRQIDNMADKLKKEGFAPSMLQEQIQSLVPILIRQSQMGASSSDIDSAISSSIAISTKTGLGGAAATEAMQGVQGMFKGALNNPSMFAFLVEKAKIPRDRAIGIANGTLQPTAAEQQRIASAMGEVTSELGGGIELQRAVFQAIPGLGQMGGEEMLRLAHPEAAQTRGHSASQKQMQERIALQQQGGMSVESSRIQKEQESILRGLGKDFQDLAKEIYGMQARANELVEMTSKLIVPLAGVINKTYDGAGAVWVRIKEAASPKEPKKR